MTCPYCNPPTPHMFPFPFQQPAANKKPSLKRMVKEAKAQMEVWHTILKEEEEAKKKKEVKLEKKYIFTTLAITALALSPIVGIGSSLWFLHTFKEVIPLLLK